jgi:hypothetical protein
LWENSKLGGKMESRKFQGINCDLGNLQKSITSYFVGKTYRTTNFHKDNTFLTQAYKNEMGHKALIIRIIGTPIDFEISLGFGDKIKTIYESQPSNVEIPFQTKILLREPNLEKSFWNYIITQMELKKNTFSQLKSNIMEYPSIWREREIVREIEVVYCGHCGFKNNARMTSCTNCGANLH